MESEHSGNKPWPEAFQKRMVQNSAFAFPSDPLWGRGGGVRLSVCLSCLSSFLHPLFPSAQGPRSTNVCVCGLHLHIRERFALHICERSPLHIRERLLHYRFNRGGPVQTPWESWSAGVPCWGLRGENIPCGLGTFSRVSCRSLFFVLLCVRVEFGPICVWLACCIATCRTC